MARSILKACVALCCWFVYDGVPSQAAPREAAAAERSQDDEAEAAKGWSLEAGASGLVGPVRSSGRRYLFHPIPFAELAYGDVFEASTRDGVSLALLTDNGWKAGPLLDLDRRERAQRAGGRAFETVLGTGGVGGFAERSLPQDGKARLELTEGVLGRRGVKAELVALRSFELAPGLELDFGGKLRGGDRLYVDSVYRLPHQPAGRVISAERGRRRSGETGGLTTIGPTAEMRYGLGKSDTLTATLEADRFVGAAARAQAARGNVGRHATGTFELGWRHALIGAD